MQIELQDDWNSYLCRVKNKSASIFVDLALNKNAPDSKRPHLLIIWLYLNNPNPENGLSTQAEFDKLIKIEDNLIPAIRNKYSAIFSGRITNDGRREFYLYSSSVDGFEATVEQVFKDFNDYKYDAWSVEDAEWSQYINLLYPNQQILSSIADERVVSNLVERGDLLEVAREINHWSYFGCVEDRNFFEIKIKKLGFQVTSRLNAKSASERYGLVYYKLQTAEIEKISLTTALLEAESKSHNGEYDGWESPVTKTAVQKTWWQFWKRN